jgi:hypothetical protein
VKDFFKKEDVPQKEFLEDLGLLIAKSDLLIQFVESIWLYIYLQNQISLLKYFFTRILTWFMEKKN